jgi:capsular exopolysaccharide synthesis family protein
MRRVDKALQVWEDSAGTPRSRGESRHTLLNQYAPEGLAHEPPKRRLGPQAHGAGELAAPEDASARLVTGAVSALAVEQYRRLAATLHDAQVNTSLKTVMITSAAPHEGKTLTTLNLALTLTDSYARDVLIIDADLRWPSMHALLGVSNTRGLTDALTDEHIELPVVRISDGLHLLTAGRPIATPLARLSSPRMAKLLHECGRRFEWVLVDTPPVGLLPDAHLLARSVGAVILVIGAGSTPAATIERTVADLGPERIIGTVLNRVGTDSIAQASFYERYKTKS